jgi:hypothetical protein
MNRSVLLASLALALCAGGYADVVPVAGSTSGSFLSGSATIGTTSGGTWNFASGANASSIVYSSSGTSFGTANTPLGINLGSLTLSNGGNGGAAPGTYTAELDLTVTFTTPVGSLVLPDDLTLTLTNGSHGQDILLSGLPTGSFTVGGETYSVTIDGLYSAASGGTLLTSGCSATAPNCLFVANPGSGSAPANIGTAYLRGTVTASSSIGPPVPPSSVPEPGSVGLLLTVLGGIVFSVRRKRAA